MSAFCLTHIVGGGSGVGGDGGGYGKVGTVVRGGGIGVGIGSGFGGGDVSCGWCVLTLGDGCGNGDENRRNDSQSTDQQLPSTAVTIFGH